MSYYASKMLYTSRFGKLEKGWTLVTVGAILAPVGLLILTLQDFTQSYSLLYLVMDYLGTIPCALGLMLLMLGVRSQYSTWNARQLFAINNSSDKVDKT